MPAHRAYQGHNEMPHESSSRHATPAGSLTTFLYFTPVDGSSHLQIEQSPTSGPLRLPQGAADDHLVVTAATDAGTRPLLLSDGRVEIA